MVKYVFNSFTDVVHVITLFTLYHVVYVIPKNFAKFTVKHLCRSLIFNKVAGLRPEACNFIKKQALAQVFSCEFCASEYVTLGDHTDILLKLSS